MGKSTYRRILRAPSSECASAAHAGGRTARARRVDLLAGASSGARSSFSPIGRAPHIPRSAVKGTTALSPSPALWPPGRRGGGRVLIACAAAPIFLRAGRNVQLPPGLLYIPNRDVGATQLSPRCYVGNGFSVTTSDAWGSVQLSKGVCRELPVAPRGTVARAGGSLIPHPATARAATRDALAVDHDVDGPRTVAGVTVAVRSVAVGAFAHGSRIGPKNPRRCSERGYAALACSAVAMPAGMAGPQGRPVAVTGIAARSSAAVGSSSIRVRRVASASSRDSHQAIRFPAELKIPYVMTFAVYLASPVQDAVYALDLAWLLSELAVAAQAAQERDPVVWAGREGHPEHGAGLQYGLDHELSGNAARGKPDRRRGRAACVVVGVRSWHPIPYSDQTPQTGHPGGRALNLLPPTPPPGPRQTSSPVPGPEPARRRLTSPGVLPRAASNASRLKTTTSPKRHQAHPQPAPPAHRHSPRTAPDRNLSNTNTNASKPRAQCKTTQPSGVAIKKQTQSLPLTPITPLTPPTHLPQGKPAPLPSFLTRGSTTGCHISHPPQFTG